MPQAYVSALVGETVEVELRDNRVVTGVLDLVDKDMNVVLGKCKGVYVEGPRKAYRKAKGGREKREGS